jgi:hypothetical protein
VTQRCQICGRHYRPDRRAGRRQRSCARPECRRERKRRAQQQWLAKNPGYFRGRYEYVKTWRQRRRDQRQHERERQPEVIQGALCPDHLAGDEGQHERERQPEVIQDTMPPKNAYEQLTLLIPACRAGVIQDEIVLKRLTASTFIAHGG